MKIKFKFTKYLFLMMFLMLGNNSTIAVDAASANTPITMNASTYASTSTYYSSVSNQTGTTLLNSLATLTKSNHSYYTDYDDLKTMLGKSDKSPSSSSKFVDFYSGLNISSTWNADVWTREHVWCQNNSGGLFGDTGAGADIHHIRPLLAGVNSSRGNRLYGEISSNSTAIARYVNNSTYKVQDSGGTLFGYLDSEAGTKGAFEPLDRVKGDVARILMYVYMHYSKEVSNNSSHSYAGSLSITNIVYTTKGTKDAAFDMLVEWNELDPVDTFEANRNEYCAGVTGVRNPFIDHPEYANAIWGDGTLSGGTSSGGSTGSGSTSGGSGSSSSGTTTETIETKVYRQLKSATGITNGSRIIIAAKDYNYAMNTNQKTDNRGRTAITKYTSGTDNYLTPSSTTEILEVQGTSNGKYALYTGDGYLYAASSSYNYLRTKTSIGSGSNAYWKFNFTNGAANIVSQGSYTRNTIRYNSTSGLFSCYAEDNDQKDVAIYKEYIEKVIVVVPDTGGNSGNSDPSYEYPIANSELTIAKALEVANAAGSTFTTDKYKIKGVIQSIENATYGDMTIKDSAGNSIYVYGVYNSDGTIGYDALGDSQPKVGDTVTLLGILGTYNGTPEMKYGWIMDLEKVVTNEETISNKDTEFSLSFNYLKTINSNNQTSSLTFDDVAKRVEYSTEKQVWSENGITLTNNKGSSTTNIGDYYNPIRLYKNSSVEIAIDNTYIITKVVFNLTTSTYASNLNTSLGANSSISGKVVTYTPTINSNNLSFTLTGGLMYLNSIDVSYEKNSSDVSYSYGNIGITFGANVEASLFNGYTKVSGGLLIDNASKYTNTTLKDAYEGGTFGGIKTSMVSLSVVDEKYSIGTTIDVIDGMLNDSNKKYLEYEFVAAAYFTLVDASGNTQTIILNQKSYSVKTMVNYYVTNALSLGLNSETINVIESLKNYIG